MGSANENSGDPGGDDSVSRELVKKERRPDKTFRRFRSQPRAWASRGGV